MKATTKSNKILRAQRALIVGYLIALAALATAVALMPTKVLVWNVGDGSIYGHSILLWLALVGVLTCYCCFKRKNSYFKGTTVKLPKKAFGLCRSKECICLLPATAVALVLFLALQSTLGPVFRFILFAVLVFLLGLYLGANSYEYLVYCKHRQVRRDEI